MVQADDRAAGVETELMARFRERRGAAEFQDLYEQSRAPLRAWIAGQVRMRRIPEDPDELLHETFVNIFRYCGGFRDERSGSFRVWSRRIATNVVRRAALRRFPGVATVRLDPPSGGRTQEPADTRCGPSEELSRVEEDRDLARAWILLLSFYADAFSSLRAREQRALELIEIEGCSYVEAAGRLGVGASNMKMIVFRARKRIQAAMVRRMTVPTSGELAAAG